MKKSLLLTIVIGMLSSSVSSMDQPMEEPAKHPRLLTFVSYKDPILMAPTQPVAFPLSQEGQDLIQNMIYSIHPARLKEAKAPWDVAAGMSANQWGYNKRIFIYAPKGYKNDGDGEVIINPSFFPLDSSEESKGEGCFSMPLTRCVVKRYKKISVTYQDISGDWRMKELEDFSARVWQHEAGHLNGCLCEDPKIGQCLEKRVFHSQEEMTKFLEDLEAQSKSAEKTE